MKRPSIVFHYLFKLVGDSQSTIKLKSGRKWSGMIMYIYRWLGIQLN